MSRFARRSSVITIVFLTVGALLGGIIGSRVLADGQRVDEQIFDFTEIFTLVQSRYVGDADSEEMVEEAIAGMLRTLDPHSNYLGPETFSEMRDEQRGKFHGLGIQITKRGPDKPLTIIAPIDDTPADRAGLRSGDVISKIEGEPTLDLTVHQAVRLLKGDKGTRVTITIERLGTVEPFEVTIERDEIPIESVRLAYMLAPNVGFVRVSNFTSTTAGELDRAIELLSAEGMTRLILDLRGNPGGLLDQAVQVSERFVDAGKLIVYTRGRIPGSNQDYVAKRGVQRLDAPLVLLVDGSSASASEIVAGAIQDHDRGLVVGETTFGKGLVQRVIPLMKGGALAVTTAKYYTPAGRLIQRDYSDFEEYYMNRAEEEAGGLPMEIVPAADEAQAAEDEDHEVFYTDGNREVYGGGGIQPDYIVKSPRPSDIVLQLMRENVVFEYAVRYSNAHPDLEIGFPATPELIQGFRSFLEAREFEYEIEEFDESLETITLRLRAQISRVKWNQVEEGRVLAAGDPQIQRALELFPEAAKLAGLLPEDSEETESELRAQLSTF